jgi:pimeloyl-ACP methyl ester carboxylesterase
MMAGVRERVVRFGPQQSLVGILTSSKGAPSDLPHVVFVNAGIIHRVGPNRLYVDMARAVAALGYPVLRFDLAGLGDSDANLGGGSLLDSAIHDVRGAMDHLVETRQASEFLVFGLCSGANYAVLTAFVDPRVVGLMLIDPTVARTRRSAMVHVVRRLRNMSTLRELILLRHPVFRRSLGSRSNAAMSVMQAAEGQSGQRADVVVPDMGEAGVRAAMTQLIDRGVHMMIVFTGGVNHVYNYYGQLFDLLPGIDFRQQLKLEYMPETDHTVSDVSGRARFITSLSEWLQRAFPSRRPLAATDGAAATGADATRVGTSA